MADLTPPHEGGVAGTIFECAHEGGVAVWRCGGVDTRLPGGAAAAVSSGPGWHAEDRHIATPAFRIVAGGKVTFTHPAPPPCLL